MPDRREFMQRSALAAALFGLNPADAEEAFGPQAPPLPQRRLLDSDPERYWAELRRQWLLAAGRINLNCGSVGCTPLPVLRAMIDHLLCAEAFEEREYPWFGYEENRRLRSLRDSLAAFLGCKRDELALVRNATEGNNVVCNGLDMKPGEEALLTDQEHPGGRCCWEQKAARYGIKLRHVALPRPPASVGEIVDRFAAALTPRTRIVVFSHIASPTGLVLPVKELCELARRRGILTHVDGAHAIGQIPLNLHELGCDFYVTSPHKWLLAPKGTGTLYVREELQKRLWVNIATANWNNYEHKAYRFSWLGTSNLSVLVGLKAALDFYATLGADRIYRRIHQLASQVRACVQRHPRLRLINASGDAFYAGMVSFEAVKGDLGRVAQECMARKIRISGGKDRMRISTHIFTRPTELDAFFEILDRDGAGG